MTCEETRAVLSAAEGGAPPPGARDHLGSCADCGRWAAALDRLPARLASWPAPDLADGFESRIRDRIARGRPRPWTLVAAEFLIFALGVTAGIGYRVLSPGDGDAPASIDFSDLDDVVVREHP